IMPLVWAQAPHVRFPIGGCGPPEPWRERRPDPRLEWLALVPDQRVSQASASMCFATLRQGGGATLKTLSALASCLTVLPGGPGGAGGAGPA
ncbi:glycosyltransferase family 1 protein, partial [Pseudomonas syringae pv. tagetis]